MTSRKTLGIISILFAITSALMTLTSYPPAAAGFAIASGIAGLAAGLRKDESND